MLHLRQNRTISILNLDYHEIYFVLSKLVVQIIIGYINIKSFGLTITLSICAFYLFGDMKI